MSRLRHDLRNRLHVLLGYTELLQSVPSELSAQHRRWIQRIQIAAEEMEQIVNALEIPPAASTGDSGDREDPCR